MCQDGYPVIIFPKEHWKAVVGTQYDFEPIMTRSATYTVDGEVYRVAHAVSLHAVKDNEADYIDEIIHAHVGVDRSPTLGDASPLLQRLRDSFREVHA
jgi:hypothetical protein